MDARTAGRRLLSKVRPAPAFVEGRVGGMRVRVPGAHRGTYLAEEYEPAVAAALRGAIRPGDVCADVGAHIGWFTLVMAESTGAAGRVVAFEADRDNVATIRSNIAINALEGRVAVEELAVSDRSGQATLWEGRRGSGMEFTLSEEFAGREGTASGRSRVVRTVSLDDYFRADARLDVVKMDIEGAGPARHVPTSAASAAGHHPGISQGGGLAGRRGAPGCGLSLLLSGRRCAPGTQVRR
jgi:FkbM family methyltransferase